MKPVMILIVIMSFTISIMASDKINGRVYNDSNKNGVWDKGEKGIQGILVSNGVDIVETGTRGNFALSKIGHQPIFVIKPFTYQLTVFQDNEPVFYENGVNYTDGRLEFGLFEKEENEKLNIVFLGDIQPHNIDEVYYQLRTSSDGLRAKSYDFSMALGDVVADNPVLLPLVKQAISASKHTSYFTIGNHDINWDSLHTRGDEYWDNEWINTVGPTHYAMSWGHTNILTVDDINVKWNTKKNNYDYDYLVRDDQITFIKNYLTFIDKDRLLIVTLHAAPDIINNKKEFYSLFEGFSNVLFVFGHFHITENYFIGKEQGWPNETPAHCIDAGAVCGGHWRGEEDMFWVPSATMIDGTPKGYVFLEIDSIGYRLKYKASGMPDEMQMHIYSPDHLTYDTNFQPEDPTPDNSFYANIYLGGDQTNVEYRIDGGKWLPMQRVEEPDPYLKRPMMRQKLGIYPTEGTRKLKGDYDNMRNCSHLWKAACPSGLPYGIHELEVRYTDPYIENGSLKHSFVYLSPELKDVNKKLDERYKGWVVSQ